MAPIKRLRSWVMALRACGDTWISSCCELPRHVALSPKSREYISATAASASGSRRSTGHSEEDLKGFPRDSSACFFSRIASVYFFRTAYRFRLITRPAWRPARTPGRQTFRFPPQTNEPRRVSHRIRKSSQNRPLNKRMPNSEACGTVAASDSFSCVLFLPRKPRIFLRTACFIHSGRQMVPDRE